MYLGCHMKEKMGSREVKYIYNVIERGRERVFISRDWFNKPGAQAKLSPTAHHDNDLVCVITTTIRYDIHLESFHSLESIVRFPSSRIRFSLSNIG